MGNVDDEMYGWDDPLDTGDLDENVFAKRAPRDPLFYHIWVNFISIIGESDKAYHIKYTDSLNIWVPKSICRDVTKDGMHVHKEVFFELKARAKEAMSVPKTFRKPRMFK